MGRFNLTRTEKCRNSGSWRCDPYAFYSAAILRRCCQEMIFEASCQFVVYWYIESVSGVRFQMPSTAEIIHEAESLPVEERTLVVDSLLRSLNSPDPDIDKKWSAVAQRRLQELRSGRVKSVPGEEVFARIRQRFAI